jgi:hypothetical protein
MPDNGVHNNVNINNVYKCIMYKNRFTKLTDADKCQVRSDFSVTHHGEF